MDQGKCIFLLDCMDICENHDNDKICMRTLLYAFIIMFNRILICMRYQSLVAHVVILH